MICIECNNEFDSEEYLFCPMCGTKSPDLDIPIEMEEHEVDGSEGQHAVPHGFVLEPSSGLYYKCRKIELSKGIYAKEVCWFNIKTGRKVVKDYRMSSQQVSKMSYEEKKRLRIPIR